MSLTLRGQLGSTSSDHQLEEMARNYRSASSVRSSVKSPSRSMNREGEGDDNPSSPPATPVDPLDSLRSRQRSQKEFSFKDCCRSSCEVLYNFTIASCRYTFCNICSKKRRKSYINLDEPDGSSEGINAEIDAVKTELKFHFMNPFEKWKYPERRRFPWKLLMQLLVIILVTIQLCLLATQRRELQRFVFNNRDTFVNLFIKKPDGDKCPSSDYYDKGSFSTITTHEQFWKQLNFTAARYYSIKKSAIGPYGYGWNDTVSVEDMDGDSDYESPPPPPLHLYVTHYEHGSFSPETKTYTDPGKETQSLFIIHNKDTIFNQLNDTVVHLNFSSITSLWFEFNLSSMYLDSHTSPLCTLFNIQIEFTNDILSGSMSIYLHVNADIDPCTAKHASKLYGSGMHDTTATTVVGALVLVATIISTIQCIRSITTSARFTKRIRYFFLKHFNYKLRLSEYLPLYNLWFVGVIFSNLLVAVGTVLFLITNNYIESAIYELNDVSSIIYGLGVFFQWLGILRFLSYFDKYNILLLTLRLAMPSVIRFMVCGSVFYIAFLLLGWLVLGPYHPKFGDPSITSECLYSLINGDDMFNTYIMMDSASLPAFIFSKIYLYVFISLFIYVVLSVFISLISDTYETLHELWSVRSRGLLQDFANNSLGQADGQERQNVQSTTQDTDFEFLSGSHRSSNENTPLIAHGVPLIARTDHPGTPTFQHPATPTLHRQGTPTLHLHPPPNNNSPRIQVRGIQINSGGNFEGSSLYPRLGPINNS